MHGLYVIEETNMAIPLSVISKAQKGKNADHAISDKNLIALQYGMENAIAVIDNPARNSLAFITSLEEDGGQVAVFFDKNVQFDGDQVNKATSIHRRTNIVGLMNNLSENAIIYVKNKNEFDALVGMADSIPAAYKGKIKFVDESISQDGDSVKRSDSDIAQIESVISEAHRDKKETVSKNGKRHPVLGELAFSKGDTRKQVIVNAKEVTENSEYDPVFSSTNNSHGWLDANGWESRKTFVLAGDGYIYDAFLKIAKAKDGRNILYGVNVDITKGTAVDKGATSKRAAVLAAIPNGDMVSQDGDSVKRSDSDIAQIESVISEAHRDKEEMYSDFDGQEAPKNVQQEIKCSTRFNEEYMDAAIARNEKLP